MKTLWPFEKSGTAPRQHGVASHKTGIFRNTAVKISDLAIKQPIFKCLTSLNTKMMLVHLVKN